MKKWVITLLAVAMVLGLAVTVWSSEGTGRSIVLKIGDPFMTVDGVRQEVDPGRGTKPVVLSSRTLVPIRAIAENMGGTVTWIPERQEVNVTVYDKVVTLTLGSNNAYIEKIALPPAPPETKRVRRLLKLDVPARTVNGRTVVPVRFVTESLGAVVNWNAQKQTVTITFATGGSTPTVPPTQGNTAPTQGNTAPTQGSTTPTQGNTAPTQGNTPPANEPPTHSLPHAGLEPGADTGNFTDCAKCHPNH